MSSWPGVGVGVGGVVVLCYFLLDEPLGPLGILLCK